MFEKLNLGEKIETTVVAVSGDTVFIDLNAKSEGVINAAEFADENGNLKIREGDKITAIFVGENHGEMKFTTRIAGENAGTEMLENAFKTQEIVNGNVEKEIKGGFEIRLGESRAFCPYSQMGGRNKEENSAYIGRTLPFLITEFKEGGKNILVSNRKVQEAERAEHIVTLSKKVTEGAVVEGTVKSIQSFGAFVDVDGFQTLLPISEISHKRVNDASEVLEVGQKITAKVIKADWNREKVSISTKALEKDPWDSVLENHKAGEKFDGKITRIADFGLFVQIEPGIDGLVHASAIEGVDRNTNLKKKFNAGDTMSVIVKEIDAKARRISLLPATSVEQDNSAKSYLSSQNDSETYNPFAALLKK